MAAVADTGGEWTCADSDCHHVNYARRTQCNKCQRERSPERSSSSKKKLGTEIGKAAAEKSRGLFSAEDWQCSKCANVNWARRQTCNMCNAPKFSDVEERTGYGGGYNDRGVVEYKEREESDSEYDEFGRLKKRKNKDGHSENNTNKRQHKNDDGGAKKTEEEDDDDEDGDGDYSKYDLWGDGDVLSLTTTNLKSQNTQNDESNTKTKTKKKEKSPTRSRSSSKSSYSTSTSSSDSTSTTSSSSSQTATRQRSRSRSRTRTAHRTSSLTKDNANSRPSGSSSSYSSHSSTGATAAKKPYSRDAAKQSPRDIRKRTRSRSSSAGKQRHRR